MSLLLSGSEELRIYRGKDFIINEHIVLHIPTLGEIADFGEDEYFSTVQQFTSSPFDMCAQLWDIGIDFTEISDYQLFSQLLINGLTIDHTQILFKALDFQKFVKKMRGDDLVLYDPDGDWYIDELTYNIIADVLRSIHLFEHRTAVPANEGTKQVLIDDAREAALMRQKNANCSYLKNLISSMINVEGFKYNHRDVWDMPINAFMDSVARIGKIKNANLLLQSGYSGFGVNLKDVNKKQLDWMGDLY